MTAATPPARDPRGDSPARVARRLVLQTIGLGGFCLLLTMLALSMRAVMDIGGSCADGGPYVSARPCPDMVAWMFPVSIVGGVICVGIYLIGRVRQGPNLVALAWPALFLSLGWNFLDYGIDGPGEQGAVAGWLVCAVVFILMGGLPLLVLRDRRFFALTFLGDDGTEPPPPRAVPERVAAAARVAARGTRVVLRPRASSRPSGMPDPEPRNPDRRDLVSGLERIAALRDRGVLTEAEFQEAKRQLLADPGGE